MARYLRRMNQLQLPGQTAFYKGKVRDVYTINEKILVMIASDRISAFDVILPRPIPFKGQVLNQIAAYMLQATADLAIVVGGYNSSNTSHLVELCEEKLPTYFINSEEKIISSKEILHYNFHTHTELLTSDYLPSKDPVDILITSGASCPDALVEGVINKIWSFFPNAKNSEEIMHEL